MTYRELYLKAKAHLAQAGVDSPGFDAAELSRHFLGLDRPALALQGGEPAPPQAQAVFWQAVTERAARRPLQYILGEWPFMGLTLQVGEGVLIPREDTAVVVEALAGRLAGLSAPRGLDLCAGTGAAALGLCSLCPGAQVSCVELDDSAWAYLQVNLRRYPQYAVRAVQADVLDPAAPARFPAGLDFVLSNPPYIAAAQLPSLQPEVRREPALALDGGADGLAFYRAIAKHWAPLLRPGGVLAVEIGETQAPDVCAIFLSHGLTSPEVCTDLAALNRAVLCIRP